MNTSCFAYTPFARSLRHALAGVFCGLLLLSGCGNKGALYIPPPPSQPQTVDTEQTVENDADAEAPAP